MAVNRFENSRVSEGTLNRGAKTQTGTPNDAAPSESRALSRDDERDGFAASENTGEGLSGGNRNKGQLLNSETARPVLAASTITGDRVRNPAGEDLGKIEEIMLDMQTGRIVYGVLSFGGFLGIGDKLFAVPWRAMQFDTGEHEFILDIDRKLLETAPGFDKHNWPDMADPAFGGPVHKFYKQAPYWDKEEFTDAGDYVGDNAQPNRSTEYEPAGGFRQDTKH